MSKGSGACQCQWHTASGNAITQGSGPPVNEGFENLKAAVASQSSLFLDKCSKNTGGNKGKSGAI